MNVIDLLDNPFLNLYDCYLCHDIPTETVRTHELTPRRSVKPSLLDSLQVNEHSASANEQAQTGKDQIPVVLVQGFMNPNHTWYWGPLDEFMIVRWKFTIS